MPALRFLYSLKDKPPPPKVYLEGDDLWLKGLLTEQITRAWTGEKQSYPEVLVGTAGLEQLALLLGGTSLFAEKKVVLLRDAWPGEKGNNLSSAGKNQLKVLADCLKSMDTSSHCLVISAAPQKKGGQLSTLLAQHCTVVESNHPPAVALKKWLPLLARKQQVTLSDQLVEQMAASGAPLETLAADIEKLALLADDHPATVEMWRDVSQFDPEPVVWEIGTAIGNHNPGQALTILHQLSHNGMTVQDLLPALQLWNQQRLQVKSFDTHNKSGTPPGMHSFAIRRTRGQIEQTSLARLRKEQRQIGKLDWLVKQNQEDPWISLEKFVVEFSQGKNR